MLDRSADLSETSESRARDADPQPWTYEPPAFPYRGQDHNPVPIVELGDAGVSPASLPVVETVQERTPLDDAGIPARPRHVSTVKPKPVRTSASATSSGAHMETRPTSTTSNSSATRPANSPDALKAAPISTTTNAAGQRTAEDGP